ncbi:MAG: hypothetical protein HY815_26360 [Candidatus Riflebacteria bacterium]|nr:hypothetical protein [Candidatus Riflebacteria bacterium]
MTSTRDPRPASPGGLTLAALGLGAWAQLVQVLVFREIMALCHGSEILFGVVLAAGLGWTALGTALAGRWIGRTGGARPAIPEGPSAGPAGLRETVAALAGLNGLVLALQIAAARGLAGFGTVAAGQTLSLPHSLALAAVVTAPASILGGLEFGLALGAASPAGFSTLYRAESWGAAVAGLGTVLLVTSLAGPVRTALLGGAALALATWFAVRPDGRSARTLIILGTALSLALACPDLERPLEELFWSGRLPGYRLLEVRESGYGRLCALSRPGTAQVSLYHSGALMASFEPGAATSDLRPFADLCATLHPAPRRALLVGGALGRLPEELMRHDLERVDAVELDGLLFDLARAHGGRGDSGPGVRRLAADGRAYVRNAPRGEYDLVVVSPGEPDSSTVNRYCTVDFFVQCRRAMADGGTLVLTVPTHGAGADYVGGGLSIRGASVFGALRQAFPQVRAAPVNGFLFAASAGAGTIDLDPAALGRRLAGRPRAAPRVVIRTGSTVETAAVSPEDYFAGLFGGVLATQESLDRVKVQQHVEALETALASVAAVVNRDDHPVVVAESLILGAEMRSGHTLADLLRAAGPWTVRVPAALALLALGGALAAGRVARRRQGERPTRPALLMAAFIVGLAGMALQVGLLAAYQNVRGCVYQEIGGIVGSFMVGLAVGARSGDQRLATARTRLVAALSGLAVLAAAAGSFAGLLAGLSSGPAAVAGFWGLVFATGLLDGAALAAIVSCRSASGSDRWAGRVYAMDLSGASLGALVCGAAWIPLAGLTGAMTVVAALVTAALLAVVFG